MNHDLQDGAGHFNPSRQRRITAALITRLIPVLMGKSQAARVSQFAALHPEPGKVVMLGDSITEYGLWQEWFPDFPMLNRGVSGHISSQLLLHVNDSVRAPAAVLVLIGTNDLSHGKSLQDILANVSALIVAVRANSPHVPIVIQSVMPRAASYSADIRLLNVAYQALVRDSDSNVEYLDLWPTLADERGSLRTEYTFDGLHLNGAGYAAWTTVLRPVLERLVVSGAPR